MHNRSKSLMAHFGLKDDALFLGRSHEIYSERIKEAVEDVRALGVIGGFGTGKSELVRYALSRIDKVTVIYVNNPDRERLRIGHVLSEIADTFSPEGYPRDTIKLISRLRRIMGETVVLRGRKVCVVLENAHRMHVNTLLALKDSRESIHYNGVSPLFSIILVGQEELRSKLGKYGEVRYRTKDIDLSQNGWMAYEERLDYLDTIYQAVIAEPEKERIAEMLETPLEIDHFVEQKLELMRDTGADVLNRDIWPMDLKEQVRLGHISYSDLSKRSGIPKSTISDIINGHNSQEEAHKKVEHTLDQIFAERRQSASRKAA